MFESIVKLLILIIGILTDWMKDQFKNSSQDQKLDDDKYAELCTKFENLVDKKDKSEELGEELYKLILSSFNEDSLKIAQNM